MVTGMEDSTRDNEHVMYLVVRTSLGMSPGKLGAQIGHAVEMIIEDYATDAHGIRTPEQCERLNATRLWKSESRTKILLAADDKEFDRAKALPGAVVVVDLGRTEIAANSETVVGLWPMKRSERPGWFKRLRVLT